MSARSARRSTSLSSSSLPLAFSSASSSTLRSKWSSRLRLLRPVMIKMSSMPARTASSTTYWIAGLSTTGSISFGCALVAGRNRVPNPAAGITALRTGAIPPFWTTPEACFAGASSASPQALLLASPEPPDVARVAGHHERSADSERSHLSPGPSGHRGGHRQPDRHDQRADGGCAAELHGQDPERSQQQRGQRQQDRKSTRLNSSH